MKFFTQRARMATDTINFSFLSDAVQRQRELAQKALDEAKRLDGLIATESDSGKKQLLEKEQKKWLDFARSLAVSANTTATSGTLAITNSTTSIKS